jgi:FkbM family methyltransferase
VKTSSRLLGASLPKAWYPPVLETDTVSPFGTYSLRGLDRSLYSVAQGFGRGWVRFRLGLALRKVVLKNKRMVDADPFGIRCRFYPHENLGDRFVLFTPGYYEHEERELLPRVLREDSIFVDIGANTGFYSLFSARFITAPKGRILAFEPNPIVFTRFRLNLRFNGLDSRIEAFPIGLADRAGEFELRYDPGQLGGASMAVSAGTLRVKVPCRPLVEVLREREVTRISVLKIDVEGFEATVLKPFFESATRALFPEIVIIESPEGIDWAALGYRLQKRTHAHNSIFIRD